MAKCTVFSGRLADACGRCDACLEEQNSWRIATNTAPVRFAVAVGSEAAAMSDGEWAFGIRGTGNVLQVYPDGRILVRGRAPESDSEIVAVLRRVVAEYSKEVPHGE